MNKPIKQVSAKGTNVRIYVTLFFSEIEKTHFYVVETKRLVDFKNRIITTSEIIYTVETFHALTELSSTMFVQNPKIKNKILLKEIAKINKFSASVYEI